MVGAWSRERRGQEAHDVGPDVVDQVVEVDGVAEPLADPAAGQGHHLADPDLEAALLDAQGLDPGQEAGHLALVVGAPDVDDAVVAAN